MDDNLPPPDRFALVATLFEASLAIVAVGIGWFIGHPPAATFHADAADVGWGLLATLPALAVFWFCLWCLWAPFVRLARLVDERLVPMFRHCRVAELAAISIVAGIGEEMLFRGLLQGATTQWIGGGPSGVWIGLAVGSVVFGLAHPFSPTYSLLTGLIGLYLGWLWIATGNLLAPITTHAAYDFVALVYLARIRPRGNDRDSQNENSDREEGERKSDS